MIEIVFIVMDNHSRQRTKACVILDFPACMHLILCKCRFTDHETDSVIPICAITQYLYDTFA